MILILSSCSKNVSPPSGNVAVNYYNVHYGRDSLQDMDIYLPAGRTSVSTPLLVLIHGGAWIAGDKSDFAEYIDSLKILFPQYAYANINYRLASIGQNLFPTQELDVDSAMQFLVRQTTQYHISNHFIYLGVSAGGQLALLQAYKYPVPKAVAVVSFFGPTDMADLYYNSPDTTVHQALPLLMNGTPSQNPDLYFSSSPIHYVTNNSCPTILLQGGKDPLVDPAEAFELQDTLNKFGVPNQLVYYPNDGHGWTGPDLKDSFEKIQAFLGKYAP